MVTVVKTARPMPTQPVHEECGREPPRAALSATPAATAETQRRVDAIQQEPAEGGELAHTDKDRPDVRLSGVGRVIAALAPGGIRTPDQRLRRPPLFR
jgi:hypothetical protein